MAGHDRHAAAVTSTTTGQPLTGKVALVAGATRGAGRGIAVELGAAGATVYCTGRTTRARRSDYDRPETIEDTAELVTEAGGTGIAVAVDHLVPSEVADLARRIDDGHGRLDVLVNDIGGSPFLEWEKPIWEQDLARGLRLLRDGLETHLVTAHHVLPLLIREPGGLVIEVGDGTAAYNSTHYRESAFHDVTKNAVNRLAFVLGHELQPHGVTVVGVTPGWLRSELMLDSFQVAEETWREVTKPRGEGMPFIPDFATSETPRFIGRAVAALAADPDRARWNQQSVAVAELAAIYGFTDVDGSRPDAWAYMVAKETDPDVDPEKFR